MNHEPFAINTTALNACGRHGRSSVVASALVLVLALFQPVQSAIAQQAPAAPSPMQPNPAQQTPTSTPTQPPASSAKFLMPLVISALTPVLQTGFGCIFDRLFSFTGANPNAACTQPNQTSIVRPPGNAPPSGVYIASANPPLPPQGGESAVQTPMPPGAQTAIAQAQVLAGTPVLSFIVNKLSDATPQATVTQTVQFANVQQADGNLAFDIRTGESFAILFATSVPGRVRLVNTDVERQVTVSDVYEALPAADNRMPRDWQGGITMAGAKGTEYLDVNFTPCVSPRYASDPRVTMFQGTLAACSQDGDAAPVTRARASAAKAMVFPGAASPGQPIGVAPANYAKGDALTFRITINHQ